MTNERYLELKNIIKDILKENEGVSTIELTNDNGENVEAYNLLINDEEFSQYNFALVEDSIGTDVAKICSGRGL